MTPAEIYTTRLALNLTQAEFAVRIGVSRTTIQGWEYGRKNPGRMATKILDQLSVLAKRREKR